MTNVNFETGKFYRTRDGRKAQIFMLDNGDGWMLGCVEMSDGSWETQSWPKSGSFAASCVNLVSEWREPIKYSVELWASELSPDKSAQYNITRYVFGHEGLWNQLKVPECPIKYRVTVEELPDDSH